MCCELFGHHIAENSFFMHKMRHTVGASVDTTCYKRNLPFFLLSDDGGSAISEDQLGGAVAPDQGGPGATALAPGRRQGRRVGRVGGRGGGFTAGCCSTGKLTGLVTGWIVHKERCLNMNQPNQEILVCDWLLTSHVTQLMGSDWMIT